MDTLANLQPGETAIITGLRFNDAVKARLAALGLRVGRRVALIRRACCRGPLQIRVGSTDLMLRPREAAHIDVARASS
ncbi:MAG: ferrous iron transport protein A [Burkholderiales bacterium]|jgi:ferrous iron transport protein A|nr:ferrous iron transport protein A [Burkholderiales bacterium]